MHRRFVNRVPISKSILVLDSVSVSDLDFEPVPVEREIHSEKHYH